LISFLNNAYSVVVPYPVVAPYPVVVPYPVVAYLVTSSVLDELAFPLMGGSYELVSAYPYLEECGGPRIGQGKRNLILAEYTYYHFHP
jgi:hypothetical protein